MKSRLSNIYAINNCGERSRSHFCQIKEINPINTESLNLFKVASSLVFTLIIVCVFHFTAKTQIESKLVWGGVVKDETFSHNVKQYLYLKGASYNLDDSELPLMNLSDEINGSYRVSAIENYEIESEPISSSELIHLKDYASSISDKIQFEVNSQIVRGKTIVRVQFLPFIKKNGAIEKVTNIKIDYKKSSFSNASRSNWKSNSVLASGTWYKVGVAKSGVVKLDYNFFKSVGFTPEVTNLANLRVFGAKGGRLPEDNLNEPIDDLEQLPVLYKGEADEKINKGDYAIFYVEGPHDWIFNGSDYNYRHNIYSDSSYFYFSFNSPAPVLTVGNQAVVTGGAIVSTFDHHVVHEIENSNLISSGRLWFGENFGAKTSYSIDFNIPNIRTSENATIKTSVAIRSLNSNSSMSVSAGTIGSGSINGGSVSGNYTDSFAKYLSTSFSGRPSTGKFSVLVNFNKATNESQAWLDKIEINCKRNLIFNGTPLLFRNVSTFSGNSTFTFQLSNPSSEIEIWNVNNATLPRKMQLSRVSGAVRFNAIADTAEYIAFNPVNVDVPQKAALIGNQDIHALVSQSVDFLIIAPELFLGHAEELAEIHREYDDLKSVVVDVQHIYNEYSGGRQDLAAIRNLVRHLVEDADNGGPRYVLLFGDASYDFKNKITGNTNFIPIYQTQNSLDPTGSIATDDFIAYTSPNFNGTITQGEMAVGVGRFPVKTVRQAADAVNKVRSYYGDAAFGAWRNRLTFIGDDEDGNRHMEQVDELATQVDTNFPNYNVNKVLADAYPQRATPGGHRYPDVNDAIDNSVLRGSLTMNYLGHGGELGWAHERILEVSQINKWNNISNMPLMVTATCEFSRFDDPKRTSAGEFVFLNPDGGGIGLLTTTRLVYSTPNFELATRFNRVAYEELNDEMPRLGDLVRLTKQGLTSINSRVFALLGDPALRLAYPKEKVVTTAIPDTIRALDLVTISGEVRDRKTDELLNNFNGVVYPTVYDKEKELRTLNNDGNSGTMSFKSRTSVLFRGKASVKNGKFTFSFVVPKDIDFNYGIGKISYYAENGVTDANGFDQGFVVGGKNPNAAEDKLGPQVDLYMNDSTFVNGGMTNENPSIYAKLFDQNGINTTGSGVGHDITATIDANTANQIVLNEYYETELNSYQKGSVTYPLSDLSEGNHTLQLKAWDVYNNSSTADIAFVVSASEDLALSHVLNYPNPFTTNTDFYLEHNHPNQDLFVRIQVFTISGKVVKTIDGMYNSKGFRLGPINWNGLDDFGDKIGKGVYVYKVMVKSPNGDVADKFEKLVILH